MKVTKFCGCLDDARKRGFVLLALCFFWLGNHAQNVALNLSISQSGDSIDLTWDAVPGAASYNVYRSNVPYSADWGEPFAQVAGLSYTESAADNSFFYRVTAC